MVGGGWEAITRPDVVIYNVTGPCHGGLPRWIAVAGWIAGELPGLSGVVVWVN